MVPGASSSVLDLIAAELRAAFLSRGHVVTDGPDKATDAFLTTARFNEPISWRTSPLFAGRKIFGLNHAPATYSLVHVSESAFRELVDGFTAALAKRPRDPKDFLYPGLAAKAFEVLIDQGERGGEMMCVARADEEPQGDPCRRRPSGRRLSV
jgi:hypothetical protein